MNAYSAAASSQGTGTRAIDRGAVAASTRRPRRWWPWVLLALVAIFVAAVVAGVWTLGGALDHALGGFDIHIDDERIASIPRGEAAWWALAAALLAAMVVLVVVPLALLLVLVMTALVLGTAMAVVLGVAAVALSPLWVAALLLWLALREPRTQRSPPVRSAV